MHVFLFLVDINRKHACHRCGQVAEFLKNVDLSAVAEELRVQGHWNVTVGAFESGKVHLPDWIAKLIPGGVHWLNLVRASFEL